MKHLKWLSIPVSLLLIASIIGGIFWWNTPRLEATQGVLSLNIGINYPDNNSYTITYPPQITTNQQKLYAVYSLLEQMRLEHNRVGKIASSNWKEYQGKWQQYKEIFSKKQFPLLEESAKLRESIRQSIYPDNQWMSFTGTDRMLISDTMFGDKSAERIKPTLASYDGLTQLISIDFSKLNGQYVDPAEDLTTFTAVGTGQSVTASTVSIANIQTRNQDLYLYIDKTANHFDALNIKWDSVFTSGDQNYECWGGACVSNTVNDVKGFASTDQFIFWRAYSTYQTIMLGRGNVVSTDSTADMAAGTTYYFNLKRVAGNNTITCEIDDNSDFSSLFDTLSVSGFSTTKYRYLFAAVDYNDSASGNRRMTASVSHIDLNEAVASPSVTNSPDSKDMGTVYGGKTIYAKGTAPSNPVANGNCTFTMTNDGTVTESVSIEATNFTGGSGWNWTAGAPGVNTIRGTFYCVGDNPANGVIISTSPQSFHTNLIASATLMWDFKLELGTSIDEVQKSSVITLTASVP